LGLIDPWSQKRDQGHPKFVGLLAYFDGDSV